MKAVLPACPVRGAVATGGWHAERVSTYRLLLCVLVFVLLGALTCQAGTDERPRFEVDHVFFLTEPSAPEVASFEQAGFLVRPRTVRHADQGTAGRYIYFDNIYIELLWVADAGVADENIPRANTDFTRRKDWSPTGSVSPVGIGLRDRAYATAPPAPEHIYKADWMGPAPEDVLGVLTPGERLAEPWVFRMPNSWTGEPAQTASPRLKQFLAHPNGARRVTEVVFHVPAPMISSGLG
ncbi:MAG: VOC family protein, partial [Pseudomonadota bacterium]